MRVKALVSFAGFLDNRFYSISKGAEFELPKGADWVKAGHCVPVEKPKEVRKAEVAAKKVTRKRRSRKKSD